MSTLCDMCFDDEDDNMMKKIVKICDGDDYLGELDGSLQSGCCFLKLWS